jgi:hypothetical protein
VESDWTHFCVGSNDSWERRERERLTGTSLSETGLCKANGVDVCERVRVVIN